MKPTKIVQEENSSMKRLLLFVFVCLALSMMANATPMCGTSASLGNFYASGGCTLTYNGASLEFIPEVVSSTAQPSAIRIDPMNVQLNWIATAQYMGFQLSTGMSVAAPDLFQNIDIIYRVNGLGGTAITGAYMSNDAAVTGTGSGGVSENICGTGSTLGCASIQNISAMTNSASSTHTASLNFAPSLMVGANKNIVVSAGSAGAAGLSSVQDLWRYNSDQADVPTPEPGTIGIGLVGLGLIAVRRFRS